MLNFNALEETNVVHDPFTYFIAGQALDKAALQQVANDFPDIREPGVFPLSELTFGRGFRDLVSDMESSRLRGLMERKFGVDLQDKPMMITVRGQCRKRDGKIHTDSEDKIVTLLLYLNDTWEKPGGRLRLLRNGHDLNDVIAEVPPDGGAVIAFRRSDDSWHGHEPYEGSRRCIMVNWMQDEARLEKNLLRHRISSKFKRWITRLAGKTGAY
jgi:hypothetical protein